MDCSQDKLASAAYAALSPAGRRVLQVIEREVARGSATCLRGARFVFPGAPIGSRNSPRNYSLFAGARTIRSTPSPRAWRGVVTDAARCQ